MKFDIPRNSDELNILNSRYTIYLHFVCLCQIRQHVLHFRTHVFKCHKITLKQKLLNYIGVLGTYCK